MIYALDNDRLHIQINSIGAALHSIMTAEGTELLWQGDATYWAKRAPLLFPCIGKCQAGQILIDGVTYPMPKHGFAYQMEFELIEQEDNYLLFELHETAETLKMYPFCFSLKVKYTLVGSSLSIEWRITNPNASPLYFMIGAHPAFNLPNFHAEDKIHGYIYTTDASHIRTQKVLPDGFCHDETNEIPLQGGLLPLTNETFACDTLLDCTGRFGDITLLDKEKNPLLEVKFQMPVMAIWTPNQGNAPLVCIEPWCGICDSAEGLKEFKEREFVNHVLPGETWKRAYTITAL